MFLIYAHTKFHFLSSNGSLVIAIKPKTRYRVHIAATLLFYLKKKKKSTKAVYFQIHYHISLQDSIISGTTAAPTKQVYESAMLLLHIVGNYEV
jgi:hypothetical protein